MAAREELKNLAEGEEAGITGGEVGGEDEVEEGRDEGRGMPRAVCVCVVWRWTHKIKSALDLFSHVYHNLTSSRSR